MKKLITLFLTFAVVFSLCAVTASADETAQFAETQHNEIYAARTVVQSGECGRGTTYKIYSDGELVIFGSGDGYCAANYPKLPSDPPIGYGDAAWYNKRNMITKVTVKEGVDDIGRYAFAGLTKLETVTFAESVMYGGNDLFIDCTNLKSVKFSEKMDQIASFMFTNCPNLTTVNIPKATTCVNGKAFSGTPKIHNIVLSENVTEVGGEAFEGCSGLEYIYIPKSVTRIGYGAFKNSSKLKTVYYGGSETEWNKINIDSDNTYLVNAKIVFNSKQKVPAPDVTVKLNSDSKPALSWKPINGATKYEVYRATSKDGQYSLINTVAGTSTVNKNAAEGKTYYYKVRAVMANGNYTAYSGVKSVSTKLAAPVITLSADTASGKPVISWNKISGATKYEIYRSTTGSNGSYKFLSSTTATSLTNKNAVAGTKYFYKVKAICSANTALNSNFSAVVSRMCDLPQVTGVKAVNDTATGKPKLTWNKVEGAVSYKVYRSTAKNGTYGLMGTYTGTTMTNKNAVAGKLYYYKVVAVHSNTNANSAYSAVVQRTADLARPTVTVKIGTTGKPVLSWNKVDGAVKYEIYRSKTGKDGSFAFLASTTATSQVNKNAIAGTTYYYKVKAIHSNTNANSAFSTVVSITSK